MLHEELSGAVSGTAMEPHKLLRSGSVESVSSVAFFCTSIRRAAFIHRRVHPMGAQGERCGPCLQPSGREQAADHIEQVRCLDGFSQVAVGGRHLLA